MLVKVKTKSGVTLQFDSRKEDIAVLLTPKDKEAIEKMKREDMLIVSAPLSSMKGISSAEVWKWAWEGWNGATYVDPNDLRAGP